MSRFHTRKDIDNYEEVWQRRFYIPSGDGIHYVHCCEICRHTDAVRIPGGHYLCEGCKKRLRLPTEETIIRWGKVQLEAPRRHNLKLREHPSDPSKRERSRAWKKVIRADYEIELFDKNFRH
jgi:ribosomal protein L37AE/L43A